MAGYRSNLRCHFLPAFGHLPLRSISTAHVQAWVNARRAAADLTHNSIGKYHVVLHGIFARAVADGLIGVNPCAATVLPKVDRPQALAARRTIIGPDEFDRIMAGVGAWWVDLVLTDLESAGRWGAVNGLQVEDVQAEPPVLHIRRTLV